MESIRLQRFQKFVLFFGIFLNPFLTDVHGFPAQPAPGGDYYCPEGVDPMAERPARMETTLSAKTTPMSTGGATATPATTTAPASAATATTAATTATEDHQPINTRACIYVRKHESNSVLIRKARQLILSGGVQSFGDNGKLEEYSPSEILFMHTDRQMMTRMLTALRSADRYMGADSSEQITLRIDAYMMKLELAEDLNFEIQFLVGGSLPSGIPKAGSILPGAAVPGFSINFGDLSSNMLKIILGHAKEKNYFLDHRVKYVSVSHNEGFHRTLDMEKVYIGSLDKNPSESEQVGLQVMGNVRFTSEREVVQFDRLGVMFAIRSGESDSKVIQDSPGNRRVNARYGDPIYLMHKETHYSGEKKGQGFLFYMDGNQSINSVLLITATPLNGDSRVYGPVGPPLEDPQQKINKPPPAQKKTKEPPHLEDQPGSGWNFMGG